MTVREVRLYGDPVLTTRAEEITEFGPSLERLAQDMLETMEAAGGVGLAANQIGVTKRIFVFDCSHYQHGLRGAVINPVWEAVGQDMQLGTEGCLSIPGISQPTERFSTVLLRGFDPHGRPISMLASGLMARCIQHETDHLDGILFLQRLSDELRKDSMKTIRQSEWFNA
ncbi:peptide deformylase [Corynebacterium sp. HMSC062E11]|uniref:peptide deformylase n=1 Tax=unclassified Corynebacterium TaxID=2624378 RepID=UPI0008A35A30|nr:MULTISPECIES: peptide deformylase [unclassified Corynebacterium]MDK6807155.1 peptide deformylase [Corynebacterium aurimucosum]MDK8898034.1 peptide deformylase [Corynebacterium sp. MSK004]NJJ83143.1 peptide deformylase [Corynebacterium aurimucosum]OFK28123.1 peptide deformylase [Corynebacterium sp. HMSC062E11]OFL61349.1 peptide deformylase [Corynebacterium sp. HMSC065D07]